jgi:hypothetical protein
MWFIPAPEGLSQNAWHFLAIFLAVVIGLILEPIPAALVGFTGISVVALLGLIGNSKESVNWALSGFSNSVIWLIFAAFMFAAGYKKTGLGRFGPYLQVKTKFYSLKTDDPYTIDLNRALEIIKDIDEAKEKSTIKTFDKEKIQILVGQYGPYIKQGRKNFKIPKGKNAEELTLEECLEIIEKDSKGSTKRTTTKKSATEKKTTAKKTTKKSTDKK